MVTSHRVTLIGRPGCHLCDDARSVITSVFEELRDEPGTRDFVELSIDDDPALHTEYWDQIPVVLIDGKQHNFWHIDPVRLKLALRS
jgi:hypothetical protein